MHLLLDLAFRIFAIAVCIACGHLVWVGLVERKVTFHLESWSPGQVFQRDTAPVRYWMQIGITTIASALFFFAAIVGW